MMGKILIAMTLVAFWLVLPIGMLFFGVAGFDKVDLSSIEKDNPVTFVLNLYTFSFPELNWFFARLLNIMQIFTLVVGYVLIREG